MITKVIKKKQNTRTTLFKFCFLQRYNFIFLKKNLINLFKFYKNRFYFQTPNYKNIVELINYTFTKINFLINSFLKEKKSIFMFEIELSHKVEIKDRNLKFKKSKIEKRKTSQNKRTFN